MEFIWAGLAVLVAVISYIGFMSPKSNVSSRKSRQAKAMKEAFRSMSDQPSSKPTESVIKKEAEFMEITQLWVYPIKSLRGCSVSSAILTPEGFYLDRRFMLLKSDGQQPPKLENMHISLFPEMCLFHTSIQENTLLVTYRAPNSTPSEAKTLEIPLDPENFEHLETVDVTMHQSSTTAYNMGEKYNSFFSECFGYDVILTFWGFNTRPVLGNLPGRREGPNPPSPIIKVLSSLPLIGPLLSTSSSSEELAFNDCAPYLIITTPSISDVSSRLPQPVSMDPTKFRSNIILQTSEPAFSEDYWSELTFSNDAKLLLTGNCGRCVSLTVDYETGKHGTGRDKNVYKLLQKDRRVDEGNKYSPIFGRYGFVGKGGEGKVVRVGEKVWVSGRNEERTKFYWPGLSTGS